MSLNKIFNIAGSGMNAQTVRLNTTASNMANAQSVSSSIDETYRARKPVFAPMLERYKQGISDEYYRITYQNIRIGKFVASHNNAIINFYYTPTVLTTNSLIFDKQRMKSWWQSGYEFAKIKNSNTTQLNVDKQ